MNAMTLAFKASGVQVPSLKTRVWNLIKDNPHQTYAQVAARLGAAGKNVSSILGSLVDEGRATAVVEKDKRVNRTVSWYSAVVEKDGSMPPKRNGKKPSERGGQPQSPPPPQQAAKPAPSTTPPTPEKIDVLGLPLREARRIYDQLKEYFND